MRQEKNISDFFDDDFEVIYDETETDLGDTDGIIPKNRKNDPTDIRQNRRQFGNVSDQCHCF